MVYISRALTNGALKPTSCRISRATTIQLVLVVETEKVSWISFREQDEELVGGLAGNCEVIVIYVATVAFKCCQVVLLKSDKDFKRRIGLNMIKHTILRIQATIKLTN